jgi:hypothetical protein
MFYGLKGDLAEQERVMNFILELKHAYQALEVKT